VGLHFVGLCGGGAGDCFRPIKEEEKEEEIHHIGLSFADRETVVHSALGHSSMGEEISRTFSRIDVLLENIEKDERKADLQGKLICELEEQKDKEGNREFEVVAVGAVQNRRTNDFETAYVVKKLLAARVFKKSTFEKEEQFLVTNLANQRIGKLALRQEHVRRREMKCEVQWIENESPKNYRYVGTMLLNFSRMWSQENQCGGSIEAKTVYGDDGYNLCSSHEAFEDNEMTEYGLITFRAGGLTCEGQKVVNNWVSRLK